MVSSCSRFRYMVCKPFLRMKSSRNSLTGSQKAAATRRAKKKKALRRQQVNELLAHGETIETPSLEQIRLAESLADEYGLQVKDDYREDYWYTKKLLNAFAYEPGNPQTGYRRFNSVRCGVYYDAPASHLAMKLDMPETAVKFMIDVLRHSGRLWHQEYSDLDEGPEEDPEDVRFRRELARYG